MIWVVCCRNPSMSGTIVLNAHQEASVVQMVARESTLTVEGGGPHRRLHSRVGINGNAAGSGKTRAMLSLVHTDIQNPHMSQDAYAYTMGRGVLGHESYVPGPAAVHGTTIVLAGTSIRHQWIQELETAGCLRYVLIDNVRKLANFVPADFDVAVVGTTVYKRLVTMNALWKRLIYDETDSNVFSTMGLLMARFTWFVTATWQVLLPIADNRPRGRLGERHALRRILSGSNVRSLVVRTSQDRPVLPEVVTITHRYHRAPTIARVVEGMVDPVIMAQITEGDVQGALRALGGNGDTATNVVDLVRTRLTRSLQEAQLRLTLGHGDGEVWRARVQRIDRDLQLVDERFASILADGTCPVCMATFDGPVVAPCHHLFCLRCIAPWLAQSPTCPQCRAPVELHQLTPVTAAAGTGTGTPVPRTVDRSSTLSRMDILLGIIQGCRSSDHRVLIFSEYDACLNHIRTMLEGVQCAYGTITGHSSTRVRTLRDYRKGRIPILLLNSRVNGAGIDLPGTTDIVLFHTMTQALEDQAIGRGHRLGRTAPLRVHRFVSEPE